MRFGRPLLTKLISFFSTQRRERAGVGLCISGCRVVVWLEGWLLYCSTPPPNLASMKMYCLFLLLGASALEVQENPIRRIVNLLQATQKKIEKEGEEQEDMFEKYMCSHGRENDRSSALAGFLAWSRSS